MGTKKQWELHLSPDFFMIGNKNFECVVIVLIDAVLKLVWCSRKYSPTLFQLHVLYTFAYVLFLFLLFKINMIWVQQFACDKLFSFLRDIIISFTGYLPEIIKNRLSRQLYTYLQFLLLNFVRAHSSCATHCLSYRKPLSECPAKNVQLVWKNGIKMFMLEIKDDREIL